MEQPELMTAEEVAALLRVDARTVNERYAYRKDFPQYIKIGARKLWEKADLLDYIKSLKKKVA